MKTSEIALVSAGLIGFVIMMSMMGIGTLPNAEPEPEPEPEQQNIIKTTARIHCTTYPNHVQCESPPYYPE